VLGIDALDPDLVDSGTHTDLTLESYRAIETIMSASGEPSTHELWPTIITGLRPSEHGLTLENDGVAWGNALLDYGSAVADYLLPESLQTRIGAWLLTNTQADAFRTPATYYTENDIPTVFDGRVATAIGIPNYVVDSDSEDREHHLRRNLGEFFERDPGTKSGHTSANPEEFYELCMEMAMIRVARARRCVRSGQYELVFAYTSGLDLIGHVAHDRPELQWSAYKELDEFVGELRDDLASKDKLILVSDHGLQNGLHTEEAMIAATDPVLVEGITSVLEISDVIENELDVGPHEPDQEGSGHSEDITDETVREHLEDLGYI